MGNCSLGIFLNEGKGDQSRQHNQLKHTAESKRNILCNQHFVLNAILPEEFPFPDLMQMAILYIIFWAEGGEGK